MGFTASNIIIGQTVIKKTDPPIVERNVEGSFKALREKVSVSNDEEIKDTSKQNNVIEKERPRRTKKSDKLIEYKNSAFVSDMLNSSKD